jgi:tetratricopeptide (TPR) repeat protein
MLIDRRGLEVSTDDPRALAAFDDAVDGYVTFRADATQRLAEAVKSDPDFFLGHALKGGMALLSLNAKNLDRARAALDKAASLARRANRRERAHLEAFGAWAAGDLDAALRTWESILALHPTDLLALRLAHFHYFWLGRGARMLDSVVAAKRGWSSDMPGRSWVASMEAFAREECGEYGEAEHLAREAVAYDPSDRWGIHAVAHVLEMQGRTAEGLDWLDANQGSAEGANNFAFHLTWHRALLQLEKDGPEGLLDWYDRRVRDHASPLVQAIPDLYIDLQNAASLLWRLEHLGIDVGPRWSELADKAEGRIGDCSNQFTLPHLAMALAADGRFEAAGRLIAAVEAFGAEGKGTLAAIADGLAAPACRAAVAHRRGDWAEVVRQLMPVRGDLWRLGASHAQRDLLWQMLVDAARKAGDAEAVAALMVEVTASRPVPAEQRRAYARAA